MLCCSSQRCFDVRTPPRRDRRRIGHAERRLIDHPAPPVLMPYLRCRSHHADWCQPVVAPSFAYMGTKVVEQPAVNNRVTGELLTSHFLHKDVTRLKGAYTSKPIFGRMRRRSGFCFSKRVSTVVETFSFQLQLTGATSFVITIRYCRWYKYSTHLC